MILCFSNFFFFRYPLFCINKFKIRSEIVIPSLRLAGINILFLLIDGPVLRGHFNFKYSFIRHSASLKTFLLVLKILLLHVDGIRICLSPVFIL